MLIYHHELTLEEGFEVLQREHWNRLVRGKEVSACSGWKLFKHLQGKPIRCWNCGCEADRWVGEKHRNEKQNKPVLNLYGRRGDSLVLINQDHIIPKSLGGSDKIENLRPGCEVCNQERGNKLTPEEKAFREANPHLVCQTRLDKGIKNAKRAAKVQNNLQEKTKILEPFIDLNDAAIITALVDK